MTKLHHKLVVAVVATLVWTAVAQGQTPPPPAAARLTSTDRPTIQKLHDGNQIEIQMGHLAQEKGASKASRDLGRALVADHELVERQLEAYLRKRGSDMKTLAVTTNVDADHDLLATKVGTEFERAFGLQTVSDQQKLIDLLESARIETADDDLRGIYEGMLPTLRKHLTAARDIVAASVRS